MNRAIIIAFVFALLSPPVLLQGQDRAIFEQPCKKRLNPGLKRTIKTGRPFTLTYAYQEDLSFYQEYSTSFLKTDGKKPRGGKNSNAYNAWTCKYSPYSAMDRNTTSARASASTTRTIVLKKSKYTSWAIKRKIKALGNKFDFLSAIQILSVYKGSKYDDTLITEAR